MRHLLPLLILILTSSASAKVLSCHKLFSTLSGNFIDSRYGDLNQNDRRLKDWGLIRKDGISGLCGPTCLYNALYKLLNLENRPFEDFGGPFRVYKMVYKLLPEIGIPASKTIYEGTDSTVLAGLARRILREEGSALSVTFKYAVSADVTAGVTNVKVGTDIKLGDLQSSVFSNQATILLIAPYSTSDVTGVRPNGPFKNRKAGHYMIVVGFDIADPQRLYLQDPEQPDTFRTVYLEPVKPAAFDGSTFQVRFEDSAEPSPTLLIEAAIKIGPDLN